MMQRLDAARRDWRDMTPAKKMAYASASADDDVPEPPVRRAKKRPLTAYMHFSAKIRKLKPENLDNLKPSEVMAEIGKMWNELPSEQKDEYQRMAEVEKSQVTADEANAETGADAP